MTEKHDKHCCHTSNKNLKINTKGQNERFLTTEIAINASGLTLKAFCGQTDQCKANALDVGVALAPTATLLVGSLQRPASFKKDREKKEKENRDISILATGEKMKRSAP